MLPNFKKFQILTLIELLSNFVRFLTENLHNILHGKNDLAEVSKNLATNLNLVTNLKIMIIT